MFGNLTVKPKRKYNIRRIINNETFELNYLFRNANADLKELTVVEAERQIALEKLRELTSELQTKRLRYQSKSACKYFTL